MKLWNLSAVWDDASTTQAEAIGSRDTAKAAVEEWIERELHPPGKASRPRELLFAAVACTGDPDQRSVLTYRPGFWADHY